MRKIQIHGMQCSIWQATLTMEVESVTTGIEFAFSQFWRNTTTNRLLIKKSMPCHLQKFTSCLNMEISKAILSTSTSCLISKIRRYLECIKMQILLIKISNQPKLWRPSSRFSPEFQQQQVVNLLMKSLWKWQHSLHRWFLSY